MLALFYIASTHLHKIETVQNKKNKDTESRRKNFPYEVASYLHLFQNLLDRGRDEITDQGKASIQKQWATFSKTRNTVANLKSGYAFWGIYKRVAILTSH